MSRFSQRLQRSVSPAAKLYMLPASGSYSSGNTLVVTIMEDSGGDGVNAVQANFTYPSSRMTFQSIDTSHSNFTTTIQNSGGSGNVQIGVGILGNSLSGVQEVARVTFSLTGTGSANLSFAAGSGIARASDSVDICKQFNGANYTIV